MKGKFFLLVCFVLLNCVLPRVSVAEISPANEVLPGIFIHFETRTNPPTHFFVAVVDLKNPKLHLRVSRGGPDPDGDGKWQTTLMEPTKIAEREHFDFVVNGDFFIARGVNDGGNQFCISRASVGARRRPGDDGWRDVVHVHERASMPRRPHERSGDVRELDATSGR